MAKTTILESLLEECTTMGECFEVQNALVDGLSEEEELALRAQYAGLSIEDAKRYQEALNVIHNIEAKSLEKRLKEVNITICNIIAR